MNHKFTFEVILLLQVQFYQLIPHLLFQDYSCVGFYSRWGCSETSGIGGGGSLVGGGSKRDVVVGQCKLAGLACWRYTGVTLPFSDLRQPTRNITYFASVIQKMRCLQHTPWN